MKIKFDVVIDENDSASYFRASTDTGKELSPFESAYYLSKVLASLIRNGLRANGQQLVMPVSQAGLPNLKS